MTAAQHRVDQLLEHLLLADDDLVHLRQHPLAGLAQPSTNSASFSGSSLAAILSLINRLVSMNDS